jgi:hypothetical protein
MRVVCTVCMARMRRGVREPRRRSRWQRSKVEAAALLFEGGGCDLRLHTSAVQRVWRAVRWWWSEEVRLVEWWWDWAQARRELIDGRRLSLVRVTRPSHSGAILRRRWVVDGEVCCVYFAMGTLTLHAVDARALSVVVVLAWVGVGWQRLWGASRGKPEVTGGWDPALVLVPKDAGETRRFLSPPLDNETGLTQQQSEPDNIVTVVINARRIEYHKKKHLLCDHRSFQIEHTRD